MKCRQTTDYCGILALDKPSGISSHDLVDIVRRATGERRVGHAGTLDPLATGLMFVCVGPATRLSQYLLEHDKTYKARIIFGAATDTDDSQGRVVTAYSHKAPGTGLQVLQEIHPQELLNTLLGESMQLPPAYSAIKKNGITAYKAAREGKELELEARHVIIKRADFIDSGLAQVNLDDGKGDYFQAELPFWDICLEVSKGTYIRSIARDLGQTLGCGAHIGALRRIVSSGYKVENALTVRELAHLVENKKQLPWVNPVELLNMPAFALNNQQFADINNGKTLKVPSLLCGTKYACTYDKKMIAICESDGISLKPCTVIPGGVLGIA